MKPVPEGLEHTEQVLFIKLEMVKHDRKEQETSMRFSDGKKRNRHRIEVEVLKNRQQVLTEVLEKSGLYELYQKWTCEE